MDLVLWGHGKIYERGEKAGRTYIQACTAASMRPFSVNAPNSVFRYNQDRTAVLVDVDPARPEMRWRAIRPDGSVVDQGSIGP